MSPVSNMTITFAHAVANMSLEIDSATSISYMTWKVLPFDAAFRLF